MSGKAAVWLGSLGVALTWLGVTLAEEAASERDPAAKTASAATTRFTGHYDLCIEVMQQNIASMRYDCYRNERDAQSICRNELRECQTACK